LRWLHAPLLFLALALLVRRAPAHPLLQDEITLTVSERQITLDLRASLRAALITTKTLLHGSPLSPEALERVARGHAPYLLHHLRLRNGTRLLVGRVLSTELEQVGTLLAADEAEKMFVRYRLAYELAEPPRLVSLEHDVLTGEEYSPGVPWRQTFIVSAQSSHGAPIGLHQLLTPENGVDFRFPQPASSGRHGLAIALLLVVIGVVAALLRRMLPRA
jgi:hypothetical protein